MSARVRAVGEGPGIFLKRISGGDQEEVTSRAAGGGRWSRRLGGFRGDTG